MLRSLTLILLVLALKINDDGEVTVNADRVECDLNSDVRFTNANSSGSAGNFNNDRTNDKVYIEGIKYINLMIKNNKFSRNHYVAVGPKPDGRKFSYDFSLIPLQSKKER